MVKEGSMNNIKFKSGFTLVEGMVILLILTIFLAAATPLITRKRKVPPVMTDQKLHGTWLCSLTNGVPIYKLLDADGNLKSYGAGCAFTPPAEVRGFFVEAVGGGGGGGDAGSGFIQRVNYYANPNASQNGTLPFTGTTASILPGWITAQNFYDNTGTANFVFSNDTSNASCSCSAKIQTGLSETIDTSCNISILLNGAPQDNVCTQSSSCTRLSAGKYKISSGSCNNGIIDVSPKPFGIDYGIYTYIRTLKSGNGGASGNYRSGFTLQPPSITAITLGAGGAAGANGTGGQKGGDTVISYLNMSTTAPGGFGGYGDVVWGPYTVTEAAPPVSIRLDGSVTANASTLSNSKLASPAGRSSFIDFKIDYNNDYRYGDGGTGGSTSVPNTCNTYNYVTNMLGNTILSDSGQASCIAVTKTTPSAGRDGAVLISW